MYKSKKLFKTMAFNFKIFVGLKLNLAWDNPISTYYEFCKLLNFTFRRM